jgi:hypothetical protein
MVVNSVESKFDDAMSHYENIRKALSGLFEIVHINFNDNDFYRQAAIDNIKALNGNILDILKNSHSAREVRIKLREILLENREIEKTQEFESFQSGL